jgi:predicted nucleic-acid-binding Zn-ribbon protein
MNETEAKKCPKCGGDMEEGLLDAALGVSGRALYWIARTYSERLISPWGWRRRLLRAWRCKKCQIAIFSYGERTLVHNASERWLVGDEHE